MKIDDVYLGIDIGGTKIKWVILNDHGNILEQADLPTNDTAEQQGLWKKKVSTLIQEKNEEYAMANSRNLKCAISAPGLVNEQNRMIVTMPERLKGIEHYNWSVEIGKDIYVINDGHAAGLAEYETFYRISGIQHFLMLTLGTGVGGAIIIDGTLYQGHLQRAGHVGHMSLQYNGAPTMTNIPGSLEHAMGNFSIIERTQGTYENTRQLVDAYIKGDKQATTWWLTSVEKLAIALASLTNILAPECIVLGGGISAGAENALITPLKKYMDIYEWRPGGYRTPVEVAKLGGYAGAIGAAYFAKTINHKNLK